MLLLGPMLSVVLSTKITWVEPLADVLMRSRKMMFEPTCSTRSPPCACGLTAPAVPTVCAAAPSGAAGVSAACDAAYVSSRAREIMCKLQKREVGAAETDRLSVRKFGRLASLCEYCTRIPRPKLP